MTSPTPTPISNVRLKSIAIPPEHGAWGFLLEPIVLGLGLVFSGAGLCLAVAVLGAFLLRHPLKIVITDRMRGKWYTRTALAARVALGYGVLAMLGFAIAVFSTGIIVMLPLALAIPLALLSLIRHIQGRGRELLPELAGASALAATAVSLTLAGGKPSDIAFTLWALLLARNIPSILYIRARLRLEHAKPYSYALVLGTNVVGIGGVLVLVGARRAPWLAAVAMLVLLLRAVVGLSPYRRQVSTRTLGFFELGYGLLTISLIVIGYWFGL